MAPTTNVSPLVKGTLLWRPTKIMNMRDLSKDDDFLSHLLVEKLGTGTVPLFVHKMDSTRRLPKTDSQDLLQIVRRLVVAKGPIHQATRQAVHELLLLLPIRYYLKSYTQKQINAFATHASRYFELYHPSGCIEIAHTSRYSHRTGKSELCILATRFLAPGSVITELKGSMANLTEEEDKELKRTDFRNSDIRRDFSVIHSKQMKKNHLFLGPARFVNHDCDNNCELFREGKYITFRVLRPIAIGEEITAHYGDGYFGRKNRHCLCETCEKHGRGGYAPDHTEGDVQPGSGSDSASDSDSCSDTSSSESETDEEKNKKPALNVNERRTRRGVYAILRKEEDESDDSEEEEDNSVPLADAKDVPKDGEIELTEEVEISSELTSLASSRAVSNPVRHGHLLGAGLMTPSPDTTPLMRSLSSLSSLCSAGDQSSSPKTNQSPFKSIISTRRQKAQGKTVTSTSDNSTAIQQVVTPPPSEKTASPAETSSTPSKRITRSLSSLLSSAKKMDSKGQAATPLPTPTPKVRKVAGKEETKVKKEEIETRVLRARPSSLTAPIESTRERPPKPEIPRGPDGKPLPICSTCSNVLPVISVDSTVVWGLAFDKSNKKKAKQDCPRCIRHFAIYAQPWPCRIAPHGTSFLPTPREEATPVEASTRKVTPKALPALDRKLAAAVSVSSTPLKSRKQEKSKDERPAKRRRTEPGPRVEMSAKAKKVLLGSNGRARNRRHSLPNTREQDAVAEKSKRRRPSLSSPKKIGKDEEASLQFKDELANDQSRNTNGRFEKKRGSIVRKTFSPVLVNTALSRAQRAIERAKVKSQLERKAEEAERNQEDEGGDVRMSLRNRKRTKDADNEKDDRPRKKVQRDLHEINGVVRSLETLHPPQRILPRPALSFRGGKLFSNPNPLSFAIRAWATPRVQDESSEDDTAPVTPEDYQSPPATIVESDQEVVTTGSLLSSSIFISSTAPALTFKPSPFTFARRRWASMSASTVDDDLAHRDEHLRRNSLPGSRVNDAAIDPEETSDVESLAGSDRGSSISSLSISSANAVPSYTYWSKDNELSSLSGEEDSANLSDGSVGGMTPISLEYPSGFSSDDDEDSSSTGTQLQHIYPSFSVHPSTVTPWRSTDSVYLHQPSSFSSELPVTPPNFIDAGWDSCTTCSDVEDA